MNEALPQTPLGFFKVRIVRSSAAPAVQGRCSRITHLLRNAPLYGLTAYLKVDLHVVPTARKSIYMTKPQAVLRLR